MYKFNLEPLLNHRRYQEELLQKEFADSRKRLTEAQRKLRLLKDKRRQCSRTLQRLQKKNGTVSNFILYLRYLDRLSKELDRHKQSVVTAEKQFNRKRNDLLQIMQKRKMLEKLKEREWKAYQQKMLKDDRKFMDEVAANHFRIKSCR